MVDVRDRWAAGTDYEAFMGRWSRRLAPRFVAWLAQPPGAHWLDVGCGTGALADAICRDAAPGSVVGCDPAVPLLAFARERQREAPLTFVVAGVGELPRRSDGYTAVASLLALNFFPDPVGAVREMASLAAPSGCVAACVWDYADGMELLARFWEAAVALDPTARDVDERSRFPLCRPAPLSALLCAAGLADVHCEALEIATPCTDFDDLWRPLLGGTGPAPAYVATLDAPRRTALARRLEETLPHAPDGAIALTARAWAVRGSVSA